MSKTGGPAFPTEYAYSYPELMGMTLLDYFAGQVILGLATQPDYGDASYDSSAKVAYNQATAMLAEKAKREASRE